MALGVTELATLGGTADRRDFEPFRGELTPFVPLLLSDGNERFELAVLDVVRGSVAWRSAPRGELFHYQVVRGAGDVHYLSRHGHIVSIDGATGRVLSASRMDVEGIRGSYATPSRLWAYRSAFGRHEALPWVVLDGRTLALLGGPDENAPKQRDDADATLAWLEVPDEFRPARARGTPEGPDGVRPARNPDERAR